MNWVVIVGQALFNFSIVYCAWKLMKRIEVLENEKEKRDQRLAHLTDPNVIDSELERSARRREAFDSNMTYPPRDDSGPPARIIIPKRPSINSRFAGRKPRYQPKKNG